MANSLTPLKWRKYLLLNHLGLLPDNELRAIKRLKAEEPEEISSFAKGSVLPRLQRGGVLFVVKLVRPHAVGQLPNLRLRKPGDLEMLPEFLASSAGHTEVWFCSTGMDQSGLSVAGRLSFGNGWPYFQVLEQVWRESPRLLEIVFRGSNIGFVSGHRAGWGRSFNVDVLLAPEDCSVTASELRLAYYTTALEIERVRDRLVPLTDLFDRLKVTSYSIEFKLVDHVLAIIDWDSADDRKVLEEIDVRFLS